MNYLLLFLAVAVGGLVAYLASSRGVKNMPIYLAFSGAFLFGVTILELLPEVMVNAPKTAGVFVMSGVLLQIVLEFFSRGAEHGHIHQQASHNYFPWLLLLSLSIHAFFEGFPIASHPKALIGVMVHKIPIAVILTLFFIKSKFRVSQTIGFLLVFALMTPLGYFLSQTFEAVGQFENALSAIAIGIFLHVSTTILYEIGKDHKFNLAKLLTIVLGFALAYLL
jgi:zinc transporter ZupT